MTPDLAELPGYIRNEYAEISVRHDGVIVGVHRLLFHWTLHIGIDFIGYGDRYCFATYELAVKALRDWDGEGDPEGWHRHPRSGRRRDPDTGKEWIEA